VSDTDTDAGGTPAGDNDDDVRTMKELSYTDFENTMEFLYVQAKRFVLVFEKAMVGHTHGEEECTVSLGAVRYYLTQAAAAAEEAYNRAEKSGAFEA
jgi:hypothetical protein